MKKEPSTSLQILTLLKKNGRMTARQVGEILGFTTMGARQHLIALERDSYIESEFVRQKAGRPALYFKLSEKSDLFFPQSYSNFIVDLLRNLEELDGRDKIGKVLNYRREKLLKKYAPLLNGDDLKKKVETLTHLREEEGYMAEMEEEENYFILKEHNCPIHCVAENYPEICRNELELYRQLLNCPVERLEHLVQTEKACVYRIQKKKP
ncbi:MAG: metalloregulator ArsR/SmtB family transcription factor [Candidatus Omnitrophota bacterium]